MTLPTLPEKSCLEARARGLAAAPASPALLPRTAPSAARFLGRPPGPGRDRLARVGVTPLRWNA